MTSWVDIAYTAVALIVAGLLIYVMQKTEHDRINKVDPVGLQWMRRLSFVSTSLAILYSISSTDWKLTCLLLVGSGGIILAINALALHIRATPNSGGKLRASSFRFSFVSRLINYFSWR